MTGHTNQVIKELVSQGKESTFEDLEQDQDQDLEEDPEEDLGVAGDPNHHQDGIVQYSRGLFQGHCQLKQ